MTNLKMIATALAISAMAGCGDPEPKTVQFYMDNAPERKAMLERCKTDGRKSLETDCERALRADMAEGLKRGIGTVDFSKATKAIEEASKPAKSP